MTPAPRAPRPDRLRPVGAFSFGLLLDDESGPRTPLGTATGPDAYPVEPGPGLLPDTTHRGSTGGGLLRTSRAAGFDR